MAQYNELPVYKATFDLLLAIFQFTKGFSMIFTSTVGESLKKGKNQIVNEDQRNANSVYNQLLG
jgi:hypothetical protein